MLTFVIILVILALAFDFLNGMNDAANSIATIVSTRVLSPYAAVAWAAFFNFIAFLFFGLHVATTVGKGIVQPQIVDEYFILCALVSAIIWTYFCTHFGLPISVSHSLIGGLLGPALIIGGTKFIIANGIIKVALFIVISPFVGFILSYLLMLLILFLFKRTHPGKVDSVFRVLQLISSAAFSLGHGANDAQKTMGIIAVLLFSTGYLGPEFYVPLWVVLSAHTAIALGTLVGGWRVIKTMGMRITDLKPVSGACAETGAAISIIGASLAGIPVSTTHTISGSIMGVGSTKRLSAVRWGVAGNIVLAWIFTIPVTLGISAGIYWIISYFL